MPPRSMPPRSVVSLLAKKEGGAAGSFGKASGIVKASESKKEPWYSTFVGSSPEYAKYMGEEWGFETHGDSKLFEMLTLEGAQAGLSWATILKKRENYRDAFDDWDIAKIAAYDQRKVESLMADAGIVRHRGKIESAIGNAKVALEIQAESGSLDAYLWALGAGPGGKPVINKTWKTMAEAPSEDDASKAMSAELKKRGMKFVGSKICYSFMQACGMIVDHPVGSPQWHSACKRLGMTAEGIGASTAEGRTSPAVASSKVGSASGSVDGPGHERAKKRRK